jgi:hypothetical protein
MTNSQAPKFKQAQRTKSRNFQNRYRVGGISLLGHLNLLEICDFVLSPSPISRKESPLLPPQ